MPMRSSAAWPSVSTISAPGRMGKPGKWSAKTSSVALTFRSVSIERPGSTATRGMRCLAARCSGRAPRVGGATVLSPAGGPGTRYGAWIPFAGTLSSRHSIRRSWTSRTGRSTPNVCWHLKLMSRKSIDSAPRSRTSAASSVTAASSMPSDSTMIFPTLTRTSERVQIFVVSGCMRPGTSLPDAAVHCDDLARDVAGLVRREEHGEGGDLFRPADAPHRDPFPDLLRGDADEGPAHVGLDQPRRDGVHRHAMASQLAGERARERVHAPLGRRVVHLSTPGAGDQHGADVNDPSPAAAEHLTRGERSEERRVGKECRSRWSPYH